MELLVEVVRFQPSRTDQNILKRYAPDAHLRAPHPTPRSCLRLSLWVLFWGLEQGGKPEGPFSTLGSIPYPVFLLVTTPATSFTQTDESLPLPTRLSFMLAMTILSYLPTVLQGYFLIFPQIPAHPRGRTGFPGRHVGLDMSSKASLRFSFRALEGKPWRRRKARPTQIPSCTT